MTANEYVMIARGNMLPFRFLEESLNFKNDPLFLKTGFFIITLLYIILV